MSANTHKRARPDDADKPGVQDIHDEEIWMPDGNIIIAAVDERENQRRLFKCHRGLLASRLPVLKDMFEADLSSGLITASVSEHYEDTPIVRLYDDPKHIQELLSVLYDPSKLPYKWWLRSTTERLVGLMRLSRKYDAEDLYKHCITVFQNAWPASTLQGWDDRDQDKARVWNEPGVQENSNFKMFDDYNTAIEVSRPEPGMSVLLAAEHEHVLRDNCATAFYALNKVYRANANQEMFWPIDAFPIGVPGHTRSLSPGLLRQFINGREFIRRVGHELFYRTLPTVVTFRRIHPVALQSCDDAVLAWWKHHFFVAATEADMTYSTDPLGLAREMIESLDTTQPENEKICERCSLHLQRCLRETREYLWEMLPAYFEIVRQDPQAHYIGNLNRDITQRFNVKHLQ
ncbi:hypothetical protein BC629DRAFT_1591506 [Irpex lacteus]|nr:hypothetical protein BC629DRAFT_1591506 [Irpex lacteus]